MNVCTYNVRTEDIGKLNRPYIFLAGPTVRGNQPHLQPSWRLKAIEEFIKIGFNGTLILPEFSDIAESDKGKDWIVDWEDWGLNVSDCIMFWIPRSKELIGLTTNFEMGYWLAKNRWKLVYGRPDDSYRNRYNDIMWQKNTHDPIYSSLEETVKNAAIQAVITMKTSNKW